MNLIEKQEERILLLEQQIEYLELEPPSKTNNVKLEKLFSLLEENKSYLNFLRSN